MAYKLTILTSAITAIYVILLATPGLAELAEYDGTSLGWEHGALFVRDTKCRIHRLDASEGVWNSRPFIADPDIMDPRHVNVGVHVVSRLDAPVTGTEMLVSARTQSQPLAPTNCLSISKNRTIEGLLLDWNGGNAMRYIVLRLDSGDKVTFHYSSHYEGRIAGPRDQMKFGTTRVRFTYSVGSDVNGDQIIPVKIEPR